MHVMARRAAGRTLVVGIVLVGVGVLWMVAEGDHLDRVAEHMRGAGDLEGGDEREHSEQEHEPRDHARTPSLAIQDHERTFARMATRVDGLAHALPQVRPDDVDELAARFLLGAGRPATRIEDVESDVALDELGHQAIDRAATGRERLKDASAFMLVVERALDGFHLTADPPDPVQELGLVPYRVRHPW